MGARYALWGGAYFPIYVRGLDLLGEPSPRLSGSRSLGNSAARPAAPPRKVGGDGAQSSRSARWRGSAGGLRGRSYQGRAGRGTQPGRPASRALSSRVPGPSAQPEEHDRKPRAAVATLRNWSTRWERRYVVVRGVPAANGLAGRLLIPSRSHARGMGLTADELSCTSFVPVPSNTPQISPDRR